MAKVDIRGWPVMPRMCATCPFGDDGDKALQNAVMSRTLLQASQVCHHPKLHRRPETHLCRGARDHQLTLLHRLGFIPEPTDEAFASESAKHLGKPTP